MNKYQMLAFLSHVSSVHLLCHWKPIKETKTEQMETCFSHRTQSLKSLTPTQLLLGLPLPSVINFYLFLSELIFIIMETASHKILSYLISTYFILSEPIFLSPLSICRMWDTHSNLTFWILVFSCLILSQLIFIILKTTPHRILSFPYLNFFYIFFRSTLHLRGTRHHQLKLHLCLSQGFKNRIKINPKHLPQPRF